VSSGGLFSISGVQLYGIPLPESIGSWNYAIKLMIMNSELEGIWKDIYVAYFKVLSRHSFWKTEKSHEYHQ
jgi:hypothetical protein